MEIRSQAIDQKSGEKKKNFIPKSKKTTGDSLFIEFVSNELDSPSEQVQLWRWIKLII